MGSNEALASCIAGCCTASILIIILLFYSIAAAKVKTPTVKITSVTVQDLVIGNSSSPFFNITLGAKFVIKNSNRFFNFYFGNSMLSYYYGSEVVGNVEIPGGKAKTRRSKTRDVAVNVKYYGGSESGVLNLSRDIALGSLELTSGVSVDGYFLVYQDGYGTDTRRKKPVTNCVVNLNLNNGTMTYLECH